MFEAQNAYDQVNGDEMPRHEVTHELLAGAAGFEHPVGRDRRDCGAVRIRPEPPFEDSGRTLPER